MSFRARKSPPWEGVAVAVVIAVAAMAVSASLFVIVLYQFYGSHAGQLVV